ncbi:hypothetical protein [Acinetobacter johnsonii]|uniref:SGNH/GDSL hydrolase family protein n=1 Tax=Acinetobacter johnsonii TaxID=40214 RepID=A0AAW6RQL5_ACIJO|nr:hypothetical protein [Acinetobacter johnsonii]MDG9786760.1 hypothetical protein [Acinetobacter johnsonii]MDG9799463.1 hypothetical protein [Acinetobacter johnsonii]
MPLPNILEFIGTNISQRKFQEAQEKLLNYLGIEVSTKAELSSAISSVNSEIATKSDKTYVDTALAGFTNGAAKFYSTLAEANADIANIGVKNPVNIGEIANGGTWYKETVGSTSLTKSPYDALTQAKAYSDEKLVLKTVDGYEIVATTQDGVQLFATKKGLLDFSPSESVIDVIKTSLDLKVYVDNSEALKDTEIVAITQDGVQLFATKKGLLDFNPTPELKNEIGSGSSLVKPISKIMTSGSSLTAKQGEMTTALDRFTLPETVPYQLISVWEAIQICTGKEVFNNAVGGQNVFQNAYRQGGRTLKVSVQNNTLPANGSVSLTGWGSFDPLTNQGFQQLDVKILGIPCLLKREKDASNVTIGFSLTRLEPGDPVTIPENTGLVFDIAVKHQNWIQIIEPLQNTEVYPSYAQNFDTVKCALDMVTYISKVEKLSEARFLMLNNTPNTGIPLGVQGRVNFDNRNAMLKEYFGDRCVDVCSYITKQAIYDAVHLGYLSSVTSDDLDDMQKGLAPRRLMHDGIHYNALGAYLIGRYVSFFIQAKGW